MIYIRKYLHNKSNDKSHINFDISLKGQRLRRSSGISIPTKYWDARKEKIKPSSANLIILNNKLNEIEDLINSVALELINEDNISLKELWNRVKKIDGGDTETKFEDNLLIELSNLIEERKNDTSYSSATVQVYKTVYNKLRKYSEHLGKTFKLTDVDSKFMTSFRDYLFEQGLQNACIDKYFRTFKASLNEFFRRGYITNSDYKNISIKMYDKYHEVLTIEEINLIKNYSPPTTRLEKIKDLLLIQLHTILRFGDLMRLTYENINFEENEINMYTQKTQRKIKIPITNDLEILLKKYSKNGIPKISNQRYNTYIKELCKKAGITSQIRETKFKGNKEFGEKRNKYEMISSHTLRRTTITILLKKGMIPEEVMKITGHKSRESLLKYINISEIEALGKAREMMNLNL